MFTCFLNMYLYVSRQISDRVRVQILVQKHKQETQGQNKKQVIFLIKIPVVATPPVFVVPHSFQPDKIYHIFLLLSQIYYKVCKEPKVFLEKMVLSYSVYNLVDADFLLV